MLGASPSTGSGPGGGCVSVSPTDDVMLGRHPAQAQALVVDVFQCPCWWSHVGGVAQHRLRPWWWMCFSVPYRWCHVGGVTQHRLRPGWWMCFSAPADDVMLGESPSTGSGPGDKCISVPPAPLPSLSLVRCIRLYLEGQGQELPSIHEKPILNSCKKRTGPRFLITIVRIPTTAVHTCLGSITIHDRKKTWRLSSPFAHSSVKETKAWRGPRAYPASYSLFDIENWRKT